MSEIRLSSVLGPAFHLLARDVFQHGHTHYDLSGGRGSLKSCLLYTSERGGIAEIGGAERW